MRHLLVIQFLSTGIVSNLINIEKERGEGDITMTKWESTWPNDKHKHTCIRKWLWFRNRIQLVGLGSGLVLRIWLGPFG